MNTIIVNNIQVDIRILTAKFSCDYEKCKGACCYQPVEGVEMTGGELLDYEASDILYHRKDIAPLCDEEDRKLVAEQPVEKFLGKYYTTLQKDKCVLCSFSKSTCILKALKGKISGLDIPLHCQLYPILWVYCDDYERLELGDIFDKNYCVHAYEKGKREDVYLIDFLKNAIIRGFGIDFFNGLKEKQKLYI